MVPFTGHAACQLGIQPQCAAQQQQPARHTPHHTSTHSLGPLTSLGLRVQMGLFSFSTLQSHTSSYVVFITGSTSPASRPSSSAFLPSASFFLAVASSSTT